MKFSNVWASCRITCVISISTTILSDTVLFYFAGKFACHLNLLRYVCMCLLYTDLAWILIYTQAEVNLLKQFSGDKVENSCLKDIAFTSGQLSKVMHAHVFFMMPQS